MIEFKLIEEYCYSSFHYKKRYNNLRKKEIVQFKRVLDNIPQYVDNEFAYNQWIFNEGHIFMPEPGISNTVAEIITAYLNHEYNKKKFNKF